MDETRKKPASWREKRVEVAVSSVLEFNTRDTMPNHFYFANNSAYNLYVSVSPLVSDTLFDMIVPPYATKLFVRMEGVSQIYLANVSAVGAVPVTVVSFEMPFDPRSMPQTQEMVGASASGLLGVIDINAFLSALPAGTNQIGFVKLGAEIPAGTQKIGKIDLTQEAGANGGSVHRKLAAASTNATSVKAAAGRVYLIEIHNLAAAAKFLKFYDKASAPTVGTDTPVMTIPVAAGGAKTIAVSAGVYFATGIAYAMTGAVADADTTALTANDLILNLVYA